MFKFNFSDLDTEVEKAQIGSQVSSKPKTEQIDRDESSSENLATYRGEDHTKAHELSLDDLAQSLPPAFSYSPLVISLTGNASPNFNSSKTNAQEKEDERASERSITLFRRDLFDARYQLIAESDDGPVVNDRSRSSFGQAPGTTNSKHETKNDDCADDALAFIDNPSDLVPGIYEGGLKTWECSLDLVDCLASLGDTGASHADWMSGKRVIEIGCGTAVPSLYLLHTLFSSPRTSASDTKFPVTEFVLQDYNDLVLRLVTFPNVLLTWYTSPLADLYRSQHLPANDEEYDVSSPGDLHVTPELLSHFRASLQERQISIRFVAGSWQSLSSDNSLCPFPFDLTLTSETIYQTHSLPSLIRLLKLASQGHTKEDVVKMARDLSLDGRSQLCLVAAKVLYFGVGGGVMDFERAVDEAGGKIATVLERKVGVGRKVMIVQWT